LEKLDDEIEHSKALATWVLTILKANTDRMIDEKLEMQLKKPRNMGLSNDEVGGDLVDT
jgi:hypothetical protein